MNNDENNTGNGDNDGELNYGDYEIMIYEDDDDDDLLMMDNEKAAAALIAAEAEAAAAANNNEARNSAPFDPYDVVALAESASAAIPPEDPNSMVLSDQERTWALELKRNALEDEEHTPLSDFEYVKHALVSEGNLEEALWRIQRMQDFKQVYGVNHTVEQGIELLTRLMITQPGFILHLDVDPVNHGSINCIDIGMFDPCVALEIDERGRETNWRAFVCGLYYMKYSSQPTFAVIRNGFVALADFGDINHFNFKPEAQQRYFTEVLQGYPYKWKQFMAYNTGFVANLKMGLAKKLMPENLRRVVQLGCEIEESCETRNPTSRLRDFYLQPTYEEACENILARARALMERRNRNQRNFKL